MQVTIRHWLLLLLVIMGLNLGGCGAAQQAASLDSSGDPSTTETVSSPVNTSGSPQVTDLPRLEGKATVVLTVKGSPITIEVNGTDAPITAGNFVDLVEQDFYNGLVFHRVVPDFVAQGGDPQSKNPNFPVERLGTGSFVDPETSQPRYIPLEIKPQGAKTPIYSKTLKTAGVSNPPELRHERGAVAMARSQAPDSASSQFYITLAAQPFLDGDYAVFGYVTEGMDVVDKIQQGDRIESAEVTQGIENLKK
ncbi:peptidylprolyl isomerase [Lyngbya aestuarii]|uniref:peptidylprolyl isomerase n=1 Tax=Lyngbya aestuarii TaxID=118322 RepID=UPI00403DA45B